MTASKTAAADAGPDDSRAAHQQHGGSRSMSHIDSSGGAALLVRVTDAELVGFPSQNGPAPGR
jgi:hypothetical protein